MWYIVHVNTTRVTAHAHQCAQAASGCIVRICEGLLHVGLLETSGQVIGTQSGWPAPVQEEVMQQRNVITI